MQILTRSGALQPAAGPGEPSGWFRGQHQLQRGKMEGVGRQCWQGKKTSPLCGHKAPSLPHAVSITGKEKEQRFEPS